MEALFVGICTHLGSIAGNRYRVALPESDDRYEVPVGGKTVVVPEHQPLLLIRRNDIVNQADIGKLRHGDRNGDPSVVTYDLRRSQVKIETMDANFTRPDLSCLPRLAMKTNATLRQWIRLGWHPAYISTYIDIDGGSLEVRIDENDKKAEPARYALLQANSTKPFTVRWREKSSGEWNTLLLDPSAKITISNHEAASCDPCDEYDYLLHYRLTNLNRKFVEPAKFKPDDVCVASKTVNASDFPLPGDVTSTLLTCSNSNYP